ncbi:hypothetical protein M408DRAFT_16400 [Serendipita vermifera MAFF 305830]|uniref:Alpha/beta hydrolase fold-3 domain-containing protein n=1 Tax=Serendipita vermifera MAFF 305830 TaxID=933852 RepID=A0A0C2WPV6_SERVB|nr:hypothetical protein M408DRAFT_16400 [Serendipita vermifera MAFF 305830]
MAVGATPKIRLSLSEWGQMFIAFGALAWPMIKALFGNAPWRMFGSVEARRDYWRNVALVMIRTGGHWFSIRHLQFMMPNDRSACRLWGWMNWTSVISEQVDMTHGAGEDSAAKTERNPSIHWVGQSPQPVSTTGNNSQRSNVKVVLYIHGGGFVLPLSNGCITMMRTLLRETNDPSYGSPVYLALAEYTIAPYAEYPTQIRQCISILHRLSSRYGVDPSNLVLVGDSCGGSLCLSLLSQLLHPSPKLPQLPYTKGSSEPFAGVLLMSPWTSLATSAPSYTSNAGSDTLPPNVIRRFRDTYLPKSPDLSPTSTSGAYKRVDPMQVASLSGRYYDAVPDPPIKGLTDGAGATRHMDSFDAGNNKNDEWWKEIGSVAKRIMITTGEYECFRDDIVTFSNDLKHANDTSHGKASEIELLRDESFHAVLVSDFAFGIPPCTLAAKLSGWFLSVLRNPVV